MFLFFKFKLLLKIIKFGIILFIFFIFEFCFFNNINVEKLFKILNIYLILNI